MLLTGVCGTIGQSILKHLTSSDEFKTCKKIICIDNNEQGIFALEHNFITESNVIFRLLDIRDPFGLEDLMKKVDIVIHCAAFKHVAICEKSPSQAIQTNILGVQNLIQAAKKSVNVERVVFTSSDKAVNPTNVMGTSKLMGERLISAANMVDNSSKQVFASTRFGNVLGSSGSVFEIFLNQILNGRPPTITDISMTRFVMSIEEASKLVLDSIQLAEGGEVLITKMPVVRIIDLARAMVELLISDVDKIENFLDFKIVGTKPGEKLYEELMTEEEMRRSIELENFFAVLPPFKDFSIETSSRYNSSGNQSVPSTVYNSGSMEPINTKEIKELIQRIGLLKNNLKNPISARHWPGEKKEDVT